MALTTNTPVYLTSMPMDWELMGLSDDEIVEAAFDAGRAWATSMNCEKVAVPAGVTPAQFLTSLPQDWDFGSKDDLVEQAFSEGVTWFTQN